MRLTVTVVVSILLHGLASSSYVNYTDYVEYDTEESRIIAQLTDPSCYSKDDRPKTETGEALRVSFKAFIYFLKGISTKTNNMNMQLLIEMRWLDQRLRFDSLAENLTMIYGEDSLMEKIWYPKIFLTNSSVINVAGSVEKDDLVVIDPWGSVILTTRMKTTVGCTLYMANRFPFDHKICTLQISNWWLNSTDLLLQWSNDTAVGYEEGISPVEFYLDQMTTNASEVPESKNDAYKNYCMSGHSTLAMTFNLKRRYGFHVMDYYLPCCLLVMMSWLTFWFDPDSVPARVWIGSSAILNFFQLSWSNSVPESSGIKAYDVWEITCSAFLFTAFIEFAFVNTIDRRGPEQVVLKKKSSKYIFRYSVSPSPQHRMTRRRSSSVPSSPEIRRLFAKGRPTSKIIAELRNEDFVSEVNKRVQSLALEQKIERGKTQKKSENSSTHGFFTMTPHEVAKWIDTKSRVVFPLGFLIFNLVYWSFLYLPESWI